jgi:hypothetical protein
VTEHALRLRLCVAVVAAGPAIAPLRQWESMVPSFTNGYTFGSFHP